MGLKCSDSDIFQEAVEILLLIVSNADYDDNSSIYHYFFGIVSALLTKASNLCLNNQPLKKIPNVLMLLSETYDKIMIDFTKMGYGLLIAQLITSDVEVNLHQGLELLRLFTCIPDHTHIEFLLSDPELVETNMWKKIFGTN